MYLKIFSINFSVIVKLLRLTYCKAQTSHKGSYLNNEQPNTVVFKVCGTLTENNKVTLNLKI